MSLLATSLPNIPGDWKHVSSILKCTATVFYPGKCRKINMRGEEQEDPLRLVTSSVRKELERKSYAMLCVCACSTLKYQVTQGQCGQLQYNQGCSSTLQFNIVQTQEIETHTFILIRTLSAAHSLLICSDHWLKITPIKHSHRTNIPKAPFVPLFTLFQIQQRR